MTGYCGICTVMMCPNLCVPCFLSDLYDKSREKHGITTFLEPFGDMKVCPSSLAFYPEMCFCASCALCVMFKESRNLYGEPNNVQEVQAVVVGDRH